jgi:hypothetical protein
MSPAARTMKTLADLIGADLPVLWHEAVAVVQEVASLVGPDGAVPADEDLFFTEDGTIEFGFASEHHVVAVAALARLLRRLLRDDAPAALRSLAEENSGEQPSHPTVDAFTRALAFFERPGRAAHVLAVATRLQQYRPPASTDDELERLRKKVIDAPEEPPPPAPARRPIHLAYAAAGTLALALVIALAKLRIGPLLAALASLSIPAMVGSSTAAAPAAADPAKTPVASADATNRDTRLPTSPRRSGDRRRAMSHPAASSSGAAVVAPLALPLVAMSPANVNDPGRVEAPRLQLTAPPLVTDWGTTPRSDTVRVYSIADTAVTPAVFVRPQLPSGPQLGPTTGQFDLIVDESGNVVTVRLLSSYWRYQDGFLVSAAKAWRFRPALLEGRPVKYRLRVPITLPGQQ